MRAVNLLPKDLERAGRVGSRARVLVAAAAPLAAAALVGAAWAVEHDRVVQRRSELASVDARIAVLASARDAGAANLVSERSARLLALQSALATRSTWDTTVQQVTRLVPAGVWLTALGLQSSPSGTTTAPTGGGFTLQGTAGSYAQLAQLLERLQLVPGLDGVQLSSSTAQPSGIEFSIVGSAAAGAAS